MTSLLNIDTMPVSYRNSGTFRKHYTKHALASVCHCKPIWVSSIANYHCTSCTLIKDSFVSCNSATLERNCGRFSTRDRSSCKYLINVLIRSKNNYVQMEMISFSLVPFFLVSNFQALKVHVYFRKHSNRETFFVIGSITQTIYLFFCCEMFFIWICPHFCKLNSSIRILIFRWNETEYVYSFKFCAFVWYHCDSNDFQILECCSKLDQFTFDFCYVDTLSTHLDNWPIQ